MRIIAGRWRGRRLIAPAGADTRPTSDRARESLFNILAADLKGRSFLDLFCGTAAVALEAASRGADPVAAVESDRRALDAARANIAGCGADVELIAADAFVQGDRWAAAGRNFDCVFADPPWAMLSNRTQAEQLVDLAGRLLAPGGVFVLEFPSKTDPPEAAGLAIFDRRRYGDTGFAFYRNDA